MPRAKVCPTCGDGAGETPRRCDCKNRPGRNRIHEDDAARVAACRNRKRIEEGKAELGRLTASLACQAERAQRLLERVPNGPGHYGPHSALACTHWTDLAQWSRELQWVLSERERTSRNLWALKTELRALGAQLDS